MKELTELYTQMGISNAVYAYGEAALARAYLKKHGCILLSKQLRGIAHRLIRKLCYKIRASGKTLGTMLLFPHSHSLYLLSNQITARRSC